MSTLRGKVAIITGAGGGIGGAAARVFVQEGARVLLVDRELAPVTALARELGESADCIAADVSLACADSSYCTGGTFVADGGFTAQ